MNVQINQYSMARRTEKSGVGGATESRLEPRIYTSFYKIMISILRKNPEGLEKDDVI